LSQRLEEGEGPDLEPLLAFFRRLWDFESSEYIREKIDYNHSLTRRHAYDQNQRLTHWGNFFGEEFRLRDLTREKLIEFQRYLKGKDLAPRTINNVTGAGIPLITWAFNRKIINENPAHGLRKFAGKPKKRGVLSRDETQKLFAEGTWKDERARVGSLIAATCGLRSGEVLALRVQDIQEDRLNIEHSFSRSDALKCPKNGEVRRVPLLSSVRSEIFSLLESNPYGSDPVVFLFYGPEGPMSPNILRRGLKNALESIGIAYKERNIVFHSWRHAFAARMADRIEMRKVQLATGHKTETMAAHYADHAQEKDFESVAEAVSDAFSNISRFPVAG
jgi:integrase